MISTSIRSDFADWLSPMLVKELRQGMRSRVFTAAFYFTQLLMILSAVFNLAAASDNADPEGLVFLNSLFWFLIAVPLVFIMPVRGFGALHGELKARTLELVFLTRLSAWRIAAGKWVALMVQTLLLVCAVLPYVLLRYFLGGVNVIEDLQTLFFLVLASGVFTAVTIAMSAYESALLRALFIIGLVFIVLYLLGIFLATMVTGVFSGRTGSAIVPWQVYLGLAVFLPAFIFLSLEMAAARIAPPAENHAIRKRLIGLLVLVLVPLFFPQATPEGREPIFALVLLFLVPVVVDALAEPFYALPSLYRPFYRRGIPGRFCSLFFVPGWVSAGWYVLLLAVVGGLSLWLYGQFFGVERIIAYSGYLGLLVFPAALIRIFWPATKHFLGFYIAQQFFFAVLTLMVGMVSGIAGQPFTQWLFFIPNSVFLLGVAGKIQPEEYPLFVVANLIVTGASLALLIARSFAPLRDIRAVLRQSPTDHA